MALDASLFEAHFFKARCCRLLGRREPALTLFENAAELRPHDYRCAGLLAEEYRALGFEREFRSAASRALRHATDEVKCHPDNADARSEEHTSELQSLMRISYAVFCLKKKTKYHT